MRTSINKIIIFGLSFFSLGANALDTTKEENTCVYIGFKKGTESFGNCVLELVDRNKKTASKVVGASSSQPVRMTKTKDDPNAVGDGSDDDRTCQRYGFKPSTSEYASCRQQIDLARNQAQQQQAQLDAQQAQYQQQLEAYKKQKSQAAGLAMMGVGLGMLSNSSSGAVSYGVPAPPTPLQISPRTYMLPGNRVMTCTTTGNITSCN